MIRKKSRNIVIPGKTARFFAGFTGLILTITLTLMMITILGGYILTSDSLHERIASDKQVTEEQLHRIREEVSLLAEEYGFNPETVMNLISVEDMQKINREASRWLSEALREGKLKDAPSFHSEMIGEALLSDEAFVSSQDSFMLKNTILQIVGEIEKSVTGKAMAFREILLRAAERIAGKSIHLPTLSALIQQIPVLLLLISVGLSGIIALLTSRRFILCLRYIGAASTACAINLLIGLILMALMGIHPVLSDISALIFRKFQLFSIYTTVLAGGTAFILLVLGITGIRIGRKGLI